MPTQPPAPEAASLPVVEEKVTVGKRVREIGQVVVYVEPGVKHEVVDVSLLDQDVQVERVEVNRQVEAASPPRQEGDVTIVPVYEEVLVVEKRLMLKEEIRIARRQRQRHEQREVDVQIEQARVLRAKSDPK